MGLLRTALACFGDALTVSTVDGFQVKADCVAGRAAVTSGAKPSEAVEGVERDVAACVCAGAMYLFACPAVPR